MLGMVKVEVRRVKRQQRREETRKHRVAKPKKSRNGRCRCGARYRKNFPFGVRGKSVLSFQVEHDDQCRRRVEA